MWTSAYRLWVSHEHICYPSFFMLTSFIISLYCHCMNRATTVSLLAYSVSCTNMVTSVIWIPRDWLKTTDLQGLTRTTSINKKVSIAVWSLHRQGWASAVRSAASFWHYSDMRSTPLPALCSRYQSPPWLPELPRLQSTCRAVGKTNKHRNVGNQIMQQKKITTCEVTCRNFYAVQVLIHLVKNKK